MTNTRKCTLCKQIKRGQLHDSLKNCGKRI